jgi:two-component system sensor histidine kinase ChiS
MCPIIREHHGFIDKFIGDAVMAIFPGQPENALNAAVDMLSQLRLYNTHRQHSHYKSIHVGIGLHTGNVMLGTIGESERMDGTVIADAVNLTARLEGLTKRYGASILISEYTLAKLTEPQTYNHRFLGKIQVKGKNEAVSVFEIYDGDPEKVRELKMETNADFEQGLQHYFAKEFVAAAGCFKQVLGVNPTDKTARLYLERSAQFMVHGVPEGWQGVEVIENK